MWRILKFIFLIIIFLSIGLTLFMTFGVIPDTKVISGDNLPEKVKAQMIEVGIIEDDEIIRYYYSEDIFSFVDYGNLFTDTRVTSYELDAETNERQIYTAIYSDISHIDFEEGENFLDDSLIEIYVNDEHSFSLLVSREDKGDEMFYNALLKEWDSSK